MKIATHDSGTGEASKGILSYLVIPFARTQSKTVLEQYYAGCRFFDFRLIRNKDGELVFAHGLWTSSKKLVDVLNELDKMPEPYYARIAYEHSCTDAEYDAFKKEVLALSEQSTNLNITTICKKKPKWTVVDNINNVRFIDGYVVLNGLTWHTYITCPWFWDKVKGKPDFNDEYYTMVDFL